MPAQGTLEQVLNYEFGWEAILALTPTDYILESLKDAQGSHSHLWNFIFVRCTYADDEKWGTFLEAVKQQNITEDPILRKYQAWTTIEDKAKLDDASMLQASHYFQSKVPSLIAQEHGKPRSRRYIFYIYVNKESIESVVNPLWAATTKGTFLILVHLSTNLEEGQITDPGFTPYTDSDLGDWSFKLITVSGIAAFYGEDLIDPNIWFHDVASHGPPFVEGRHAIFEYPDLVKDPEPLEMDVYRMLKRIYGAGHYRSGFFAAEEARSEMQRIRGVEGEWLLD